MPSLRDFEARLTLFGKLGTMVRNLYMRNFRRFRPYRSCAKIGRGWRCRTLPARRYDRQDWSEGDEANQSAADIYEALDHLPEVVGHNLQG